MTVSYTLPRYSHPTGGVGRGGGGRREVGGVREEEEPTHTKPHQGHQASVSTGFLQGINIV